MAAEVLKVWSPEQVSLNFFFAFLACSLVRKWLFSD